MITLYSVDLGKRQSEKRKGVSMNIKHKRFQKTDF